MQQPRQHLPHSLEQFRNNTKVPINPLWLKAVAEDAPGAPTVVASTRTSTGPEAKKVGGEAHAAGHLSSILWVPKL